MMAQRPLLETVPETEVLHNNARPITSADDREFWSPANNVIYEEPEHSEANAVLLNKLFDCMRELEESKEKAKRLEKTRDREMKYVISRLLLLEGSLIKDKQNVEVLLTQKDEEIGRLQTRIKLLQLQNSRYQQSMDNTDSAIGSLDQLASPINTSLTSATGGGQRTELVDNIKRNVTDPDRRSVEGALMATKCRRTNTDPGKYSRKTQVTTKPVALVDAGCQTDINAGSPGSAESGERYLDVVSPRELRSYSNPDDFDQIYQKTCDSKVHEKDMVRVPNEALMDELLPEDCVDGPSPIPAGLKSSMTRKKSLSSPDLQISISQSADGHLLVSPINSKLTANSNAAINFQSNKIQSCRPNGGSAFTYFGDTKELVEEIPLRPVSPRPALPLLMVANTSTQHSYSTGNLHDSEEATTPLTNAHSIDDDMLANLTSSPLLLRNKSTKSLMADPANGFRFPAPPVERNHSPCSSIVSTLSGDVTPPNFLAPKFIQSLNSSPIGRRKQPVTRRDRSEPSSLKQSRLLKKPMLFLRSYSVPATVDSESNEINDENDEREQQNSDDEIDIAGTDPTNDSKLPDRKGIFSHDTSNYNADVLIEDDDNEPVKPWIYSDKESTDSLLKDVANHFTDNNNVVSKSAIYF